jgi:secreted trypsin-like serine protease
MNAAVLNRIVGGENAAAATWGWAASLRYASSGRHFCGGSIISPNHILTTAHCVVQSTSSSSWLYVVTGSISLSERGEQYNVQRIIVHPGYSTQTYLNDIAILKLERPIDLSAFSNDRICLPTIDPAILAVQEEPPASTEVSHRW